MTTTGPETGWYVRLPVATRWDENRVKLPITLHTSLGDLSMVTSARAPVMRHLPAMSRAGPSAIVSKRSHPRSWPLAPVGGRARSRRGAVAHCLALRKDSLPPRVSRRLTTDGSAVAAPFNPPGCRPVALCSEPVRVIPPAADSRRVQRRPKRHHMNLRVFGLDFHGAAPEDRRVVRRRHFAANEIRNSSSRSDINPATASFWAASDPSDRAVLPASHTQRDRPFRKVWVERDPVAESHRPTRLGEVDQSGRNWFLEHAASTPLYERDPRRGPDTGITDGTRNRLSVNPAGGRQRLPLPYPLGNINALPEIAG
jgi:hypothetical protein